MVSKNERFITNIKNPTQNLTFTDTYSFALFRNFKNDPLHYKLLIIIIIMSDNIDSIKSEIQIKRRQSFAYNQIEMILWMLFGVIISGRVWFDIIVGNNYPYEVISIRYFEILGGIITIIFPILYSLIFGAFPLENLRNRKRDKSLSYIKTGKINSSTISEKLELNSDLNKLLTKEVKAETSEEYFTNLVLGSRRLASSLYSRSGVYLMIGVLIAFSGLVFFYLQTSALLIVENSTTSLISLAPKFGILFFIEFIALFFLKQYKSAMDEFRYYECLQRSREETLAIIKLQNDSESNINIFEMIEKTGFRSTTEKLNNGQTTELLESKKLNKDETEIFSKILDIVGKR